MDDTHDESRSISVTSQIYELDDLTQSYRKGYIMKIKEVLVDKIPDNCGECCLLVDAINEYICPVVPKEISRIIGSPYDMTYRRSDCPLVEHDSHHCSNLDGPFVNLRIGGK